MYWIWRPKFGGLGDAIIDGNEPRLDHISSQRGRQDARELQAGSFGALGNWCISIGTVDFDSARITSMSPPICESIVETVNLQENPGAKGLLAGPEVDFRVAATGELFKVVDRSRRYGHNILSIF